MSDQKLILASLAMDLKRTALGLHQGSYKMAEIFSESALKYKKQVNTKSIDSYMVKLLDKIEKTLKQDLSDKSSEDILMYSSLVQNFATRYFH